MAEPEPTVDALNRVADAIEGFNQVLATLATAQDVERSGRDTRRRFAIGVALLLIPVALLLYISIANRQLGNSNRELLQQTSAITSIVEHQQEFLDRIERIICGAEPDLCIEGHIDPSKVPSG